MNAMIGILRVNLSYPRIRPNDRAPARRKEFGPILDEYFEWGNGEGRFCRCCCQRKVRYAGVVRYEMMPKPIMYTYNTTVNQILLMRVICVAMSRSYKVNKKTITYMSSFFTTYTTTGVWSM